MQLCPIPIARTPDEFLDMARAVDSVIIPGAIAPPDVMSEIVGKSIFDITARLTLDQYSEWVEPSSRLNGDLGLDKISAFFGLPISAVGRFKSLSNELHGIASLLEAVHTDGLRDQRGPQSGLHLQGQTSQGVRRMVLMALTEDHLAPQSSSILGSALDNRYYVGLVEDGFGTYFLPGKVEHKFTTAHSFSDSGAFMKVVMELGQPLET